VRQETNQNVIKKMEEVNFKVNFYTGEMKDFSTMNFYNPIEMVFNYSGSVQRGFDNQSSIVLQRRKENEKIFTLLFQHSGTYELGLKRIQTKDFLGIFTLYKELSDFKQLKIYPIVRAVDSFPLPQNQNDNFEVEQFKNNDIFDGVKEYEHGDHLARINWKVSSKMNDLYSKQFEKIGKNKTVCIIYNKETGLVEEDKIGYEEWFIEMSLGIFNFFISDRRGFDLLYLDNSPKHYSVSNREHFFEVYEEYSFIKPSNKIIIDELINQYLEDYEYMVSLSSLIIFSSVLDEELYNQVYELRKNDLNVEICHLKPNVFYDEIDDEMKVLKELRELNITYYEKVMEEENEKS
jgi:putative lipoic acid-binding regulatory protein